MRAVRIFRVILALVVLAILSVALFVSQPMIPRRAPPPAAASALHLERDVRALAALVPRNLSSPNNLEQAAAWVKRCWEEEGIEVTEQEYAVSGSLVRNVIVRFGVGTGARVVVGAHYDAFGHNPGADDNASGAAGLIELGRLLKRYPPGGPVELVAYTLEEPPWFGGPEMGSAVHARSLKSDVVRLRGMIALEMIGCFSDAPGSQSFPSPVLRLLYPSRGNFVAVGGRVDDNGLLRRVKRAMADATRLPVRSITAPPRIGGTDLSDNRSYWSERYPAVIVTDTAFYRNTRYHTREDTPDLLDYGRMADVVTGVFAAVRSLAGS
jgi:hypothetical protein